MREETKQQTEMGWEVVKRVCGGRMTMHSNLRDSQQKNLDRHWCRHVLVHVRVPVLACLLVPAVSMKPTILCQGMITRGPPHRDAEN